MIKIFIFLLFSFTVFLTGACHAQIPGMINYNQNNGLNSSYTYHLKQDYNGFIWIGTDNGLFRFDGQEFKHYGKKEGLKNIEILSCEPLPNGEILLIPFQNDFAYLKKGKIINLSINNYLKNQFPDKNPKVIRDHNKLYMYNEVNPKDIFIYENGTVKKYPVSIEYKNRLLQSIKYDFKSNIIYFKNFHKEIIVYDLFKKKENTLIAGEGFFLYEKDGIFLIRNKKKIDVYKFISPYKIQKIYSYDIKERFLNAVIDKNYKLWVNLDNGGVLYLDLPIFGSRKAPALPIKILDEYVINNTLIDKDGNIWFTSRNDGIFFITKALFNNYVNLPVKNNSENIKAISGNNDNIILGYNKSSAAIYKNGKIKTFTFDKDNKNEARFVYKKDNTLFFGASNRLLIYDMVQNKKTEVICSPKSIVPYTENSVLFCLAQGLIIYNINTKKQDILLRERVYSALSYTKDSLFVSNFTDLFKLNAKTKKKSLFLEGYYFTDIIKLGENLYAGATNLNGIILFSNKGIVKKITENDGLINNQIKKIEIEGKNIFWASTNSGISRIELKKNKINIKNFTQTDGLPSNVVAGCVIKNDSIFIGTSKGLGIFSIKKLLAQEKSINKKVIINSIIIGDTEHFDLKEELKGQNQDAVIFNLSFLDYASLGNISYKYKIEGLNDKWQTSKSSKIIFNSIPPGKYVFKAFGLGYNGKQSYVSTDLAFEIKPRFWQTWWFTFLAAVITATVFIIIIGIYFKKKRNKKLEAFYYEKKIAELELQAIKAQINPHFIYNCLNSIQFLLYKKDYEETENYLDVFSQMIRKTLHYSEKTFMPVQEEIEYLTLYLSMEKLRLKDLFDYKITVSEKVNKNWVIPSLLIQPFVENAIKHGISNLKNRKGLITISFDHFDSSLSIIIEDNGTGISGNPESVIRADSFGVKLSQKRIETFKQLFETNIILEINNLSESQQRQGTQIKLYITPYENQNTNLHH